jgi:hypothetical protein
VFDCTSGQKNPVLMDRFIQDVALEVPNISIPNFRKATIELI